MDTVVLDWNEKYCCEITDLIFRHTWMYTQIQICMGMYIYTDIYIYEYGYTYIFSSDPSAERSQKQKLPNNNEHIPAPNFGF